MCHHLQHHISKNIKLQKLVCKCIQSNCGPFICLIRSTAQCIVQCMAAMLRAIHTGNVDVLTHGSIWEHTVIGSHDLSNHVLAQCELRYPA